MRCFILLFSVLGAFAGSTAVAVADDDTTRTRTIEVGQLLSDALAVLRAREIEWHEGGFAEIRLNDDVGDLSFVVEKRRLVRVFYSKSTKKISGISLVMYPDQRASKLTQVVCDAKSVRLEDDGSYLVHFLPTLSTADK
jgi:hypothetical protein